MTSLIRTTWLAPLLLAGGTALAAQEGAASAPASEPAPLAAPRCDYGEPSAQAPDELSQFDFLVGDYTVTLHAWQDDGSWSPPRPGPPARWNGWYGLGGTVIVDEWFDRDPGPVPDAKRGINVRMWDEKAGEWDMMWVSSYDNKVQDLRAAMKDGVLTMWQVYPERPDFRAYFERLGPDSWHRISLVPDGEGGWKKQYRILATRIPCS